VAFVSRPFITSFLEQTNSLGVDAVPIVVIDADTCHPLPIRRQLARVLDVIEYELTEKSAGRPLAERIHWAPKDELQD
jgi:hypothetical protein